ncbi:hypothetical protein FB45DRAFT_870568 [Roridomyces roridus]|uniref:Uncharacterized protein n=1 Tax=Roridomyces roridus TaxID=1738132 RepID=A0AAD7BIU7_9AGAR|nr:hypothetical protein FB45DRAFT_870568 [Roridomyces roridus]
MARRRPGTGTPSAKEPDPDPAVKIVASEGFAGDDQSTSQFAADGQVQVGPVLGYFRRHYNLVLAGGSAMRRMTRPWCGADAAGAAAILKFSAPFTGALPA